MSDFRSVFQALIRIQPDEIYNLGGQSSVGLSFEQPVETMESITIGTLNLLEAIRYLGEAESSSTMPGRVNVLGIRGNKPRMRPHHFDLAAPMQ